MKKIVILAAVAGLVALGWALGSRTGPKPLPGEAVALAVDARPAPVPAPAAAALKPSSYEYQVCTFAAKPDGRDDAPRFTQTIADLAAGEWEYVGPLGRSGQNTVECWVLFRRLK